MDQSAGDRGGCKDLLMRKCLKSLDGFRTQAAFSREGNGEPSPLPHHRYPFPSAEDVVGGCPWLRIGINREANGAWSACLDASERLECEWQRRAASPVNAPRFTPASCPRTRPMLGRPDLPALLAQDLLKEPGSPNRAGLMDLPTPSGMTQRSGGDWRCSAFPGLLKQPERVLRPRANGGRANGGRISVIGHR